MFLIVVASVLTFALSPPVPSTCGTWNRSRLMTSLAAFGLVLRSHDANTSSGLFIMDDSLLLPCFITVPSLSLHFVSIAESMRIKTICCCAAPWPGGCSMPSARALLRIWPPSEIFGTCHPSRTMFLHGFVPLSSQWCSGIFEKLATLWSSTPYHPRSQVPAPLFSKTCSFGPSVCSL